MEVQNQKHMAAMEEVWRKKQTGASEEVPIQKQTRKLEEVQKKSRHAQQRNEKMGAEVIRCIVQAIHSNRSSGCQETSPESLKATTSIQGHGLMQVLDRYWAGRPLGLLKAHWGEHVHSRISHI